MIQAIIRTADEWRLVRHGEPTKVFKSRSAALRAANRWLDYDKKDEVF